MKRADGSSSFHSALAPVYFGLQIQSVYLSEKSLATVAVVHYDYGSTKLGSEAFGISI